MKALNSMKSIFAIMFFVLLTSAVGVSQTVPVNPAPVITVDQLLSEGGNSVSALNAVDPGVNIPNAFSPNGDGINDYFKISGIEKYPDARLFIYTASNRKIFEKNHYGNMSFWGSEAEAWWDGTNNIRGAGMTMPNGTYIYILDLDNGKQVLIRLGTVFIRR